MELEPPVGMSRIEYASGELRLAAYWGKPATDEPAPAVIYFHGDFALATTHLEDASRFMEAGFAVLVPTLRGENGNPGRLELLYGEVDDAIAAVRWLADRPEVDADRIWSIGHSVGGALSALLALHPEVPLRETASVNGIYVPETFVRWSKNANAELVRFDPADRDELELRTLVPNVRDMVRPHVAYIGTEDRWFIPNARRGEDEARRHGKRFEVVLVPGDHMSSLPTALDAFILRIRDADGTGPRGPMSRLADSGNE